MQHPEALSVIRSLGPELQKQAAEDVLLRHAESCDLAPAQLEKLAQVYNMVRQLSHMDKAEDRGSSCHQIDTPSLLRTYADGGQKSAAVTPAVVRPAPTHDAGSVDLLRALRHEINPVVKAATAAATTDITHPTIPAPMPEPEAYTAQQIKEAAWEAKVDLYMVADKLLKMATVEGRYLQLAAAEQDAKRLANPLCVDASLEWLSKYAGQQKLSRLITRHEGAVKPTAFPVSTPLADKLVELATAFTVSSMLHKAAAATELGDLPDTGKIPDEAADPFDDMLDQAAAKAMADTAAKQPKGGTALPDQTTQSLEAASVIAQDRKASGQDAGGGGGKGEKAAPGDTAAPPRGANWLAALISGATKPVGAVNSAIAGAGESAKGHVRMITDKERTNKAQIKSDASVADIQRSILIRRLAANDSVLRDMPLPQVLETYNAIVESNPEVASNPRRVLLAMREAASYEGVTLDAQKQLGDIRGASAKTSDQEATNRNRQYAV